MSEEGETRIPGTLAENSATEEVPATINVPETLAIAPPAHDSRGRYMRQPPVNDPWAPPPPYNSLSRRGKYGS